MVKYQSNEQYPLLLFIIDNDNESNLLNQRNKSRIETINSGARSIITQWPNHINTCWLIGILLAIILFLSTVMIITVMDTRMILKLSKCNQFRISNNNQSIYLVYNDYDQWSNKRKFIEFIRKLEINYQRYQINIIQIVQNHHQSFDFEQIFNNSSTLQNILIKQIKYKEIFDNTPLLWRWFSLSNTTRDFLVRILELWKFGGLSFDINLMNINNNNNTTNIDEILMEIRENYENLHDNQILFDKNGLYFGSKIPCHIVYGRILMLMKRIDNIDNVINEIMAEFCNSVIKNCNSK